MIALKLLESFAVTWVNPSEREDANNFMDSGDCELIARRDIAALACIYRTQIQPAAKMPLRNPGNFSIWLTLGQEAPLRQ